MLRLLRLAPPDGLERVYLLRSPFRPIKRRVHLLPRPDRPRGIDDCPVDVRRARVDGREFVGSFHFVSSLRRLPADEPKT